MDTITKIQTTRIEHYIGELETEIIASDAEANEKLDATTSEVFTEIENLEKHLDPIGQREAQILRAAIDELCVQFALGRMEGAEKLEALEEKIEHGFRQAKEALGRVKTLTADEMKTLNEKLHDNWSRIKSETNLIKLRTHLAEEKGKKKLSSAKDEIIQDLKTIKKHVKENTEEMTEDISSWVKKPTKQ